MGKFIFFVLISLFVSCKKDYTCKCTEQFSGSSLSTEHIIKKVVLDDAEKICEAKEVDGLITCSLL